MSEVGTINILNVGEGDIKLSWNSADASERIRMGRIIKDMLRRGYALLVEVERDGVTAWERAYDFNEAAGAYIIADFDPVATAGPREVITEPEAHYVAEEPAALRRTTAPNGAATDDPDDGDDGDTAPAAPKRGRGRPAHQELPAGGVRAVAVGRSAGG